MAANAAAAADIAVSDEGAVYFIIPEGTIAITQPSTIYGQGVDTWKGWAGSEVD